MFAPISTSAGAPLAIWVESVPVLPNEYVLLGSIAGQHGVIDDPAKTVMPGGAWLEAGGRAAGAHADAERDDRERARARGREWM